LVPKLLSALSLQALIRRLWLSLWPVVQPHPQSSSKKGKNNTDGTSSSAVHPNKTKSLESSKRKRKTFEAVSDVEIQAASGLAQLGQKKI
jgi:hypothetical protein